jgi:alkaline phosphatase
MVFAGFVGCDDPDSNGTTDLLQPPAPDLAEAAGDMAQTTVPPDMAQTGPLKRIIFFVGDGMGLPIITATRIYSVGEDGQLTMDTLPESGFVHTHSNDALVTDSAPSMSAYMTGIKCNNEVLSMTPDTIYQGTNGAPVTTLLEAAKVAGWGTGIVTTTRVTHATPAATYAHNCNRNLPRQIAVQAVPGGAGYNAALGDGVNVLMGGSQEHWDASKFQDGRNLFTELVASGYSVAKTKGEFDAIDAATTTKFIGVFSAKSHLDYELDRVKVSPAAQPSLTEMTTKAIDILVHTAKQSGDKGFFLMVEGGRIDHALHATNAKRALVDAIAFDDAIAAALAKVDLKDTLVVVTADHDHTMAINGYGRVTGATTPTNPGILGTVQKPDGTDVLDADGLPYTILAFGNGVRRPDVRGIDDMKALVETSAGSPKLTAGSVTLDPAAPATGNPSADNYYQVSGVRTSGGGSETHGGGAVVLLADGAGASKFKGTLDNTQVFGLVKAALGL